MNDVTLGEVIDWLTGPPWACACIGGPRCCLVFTEHARALQRAAHIAVRQLSDLADRRAADPSWKVET